MWRAVRPHLQALRPRLFSSLHPESILSRTEVIENTERCSEVCQDIIACGQPIGVDMEGIDTGRLGMVQVCRNNGQIYLFRTGVNADMISKGYLGALLESPWNTKVLHASSNDLKSACSEGIKIWGVYDTAVGHKLHEYIMKGSDLFTSPTISFNDICSFHGLSVNPLKKKYSGYNWVELGETLFSNGPLPEDLIYYSASDVEPLLELYYVQNGLVDSAFKPLRDELMEIEMLRHLDKSLAKHRVKELTKVYCEQVILVQGLASGINPGMIYKSLENYQCNKTILFSSIYNSAHILMTDVNLLGKLYADLTSQTSSLLQDSFGPKAKVELPSAEVLISVDQMDKQPPLPNANQASKIKLSGCHHLSKIIGVILDAECPILLNVSISPNDNVINLEIFTGVYPRLKFPLTVHSLTKGRIGELLSSPTVTKVVKQIGVVDLTAALQLSQQHGYTPQNVVSLFSCHKMLLYLFNGRSCFKSNEVGVKTLLKIFQMPPTNQIEGLYKIYLTIMAQLPPYLKDVLNEKCALETEASVQDSPSIVMREMKLLARTEQNVIHVSCTDDESAMLSLIKEKLSDAHTEYTCFNHGKVCLLTLESTVDVENALKALNCDETSAETLKAVKISSQHSTSMTNLHLRSEKIDNLISQIASTLDKHGYNQVLQECE